MQLPRSSCSIAADSAAVSPRPRSMGIWPMPSRTRATIGFFQSEALASARIWRRGAATPTTSGSHWLSWFANSTTGSGPDSRSAPLTRSRPHHRTMGVATIMTTR